MARPVLLWVRLAALLALLVGTHGMVMNDEQDQAVALHNLAEGSLEVEEHPRQYYHVRGTLYRQVRFEGTQPVGSTLLDYLAYPALVALRGLDALAPLGVWAAVLAAGLAWSLLPEGRWRSPWLFLGVVAVLASGFRFPEVDLDLIGPVVALQATNLALYAACVAFLALAVQRHVAWPAAHVAVATVAFGPLLFWATRLKYTMLSALLAATALWLAGEPASVRRNLALGLVAALAIWANVGEGAVLLAAGGVWFLVHLLRRKPRPRPSGPPEARASRERGMEAAPAPEPRPTLRLAAALVVGLLVGLVPWAMENQDLRGHPLRATYLAPFKEAGGNATAEGNATPPPGFLELAVAGDVWQGPQDFALNLVGQWTTGWRMEGNPVGVFALAPLLALMAWTLVRRASWRRPDLLLAGAMVLWHAALLTNRVVRQGWGLDARLLAPLLPAVGLLAAPAIGRLLARRGADGAHAAGRRPDGATDPARTALRIGAAWSAGGALFLLAAGLTFGQGLRSWVADRLLLLAWSLLGGAVAALVAVARRSGLLPTATLGRTVAVGVALAAPILWNLLVAFAASTSAPAHDDLRATAFVPAVHDVRAWLTPKLFPPSPLPIVTDEFGRVVFHPDHGYCDVDPSPCPWWTDATGPAAATAGGAPLASG